MHQCSTSKQAPNGLMMWHTASTQMRMFRTALQDAGFSHELSGGALMLKPEDAPGVLLALESHSLCHYHIVVDASLEYLLDEILSGFTFQKRPKKKSGDSGRVELSWSQTGNIDTLPADEMDDSNELQTMVFVEERTFLSWKPELKASSAVIQSTTDAVSSQSEMYFGSFKGFNPRRFV